MADLTPKQLKHKYGVTRKPLVGDSIMVKPMDHDFGCPAVAVLIFNREAGTYTSANVYGEKGDQRLGKGYDPEKMTHPIPPTGDEKWKVWRKRGYVTGNLRDFDVFEVAALGAALGAAQPTA